MWSLVKVSFLWFVKNRVAGCNSRQVLEMRVPPPERTSWGGNEQVQPKYAHTHRYIYIYIYIHTCTHTSTHPHTHIYIYIYIYIHMYVWYVCVFGLGPGLFSQALTTEPRTFLWLSTSIIDMSTYLYIYICIHVGIRRISKGISYHINKRNIAIIART